MSHGVESLVWKAVKQMNLKNQCFLSVDFSTATPPAWICLCFWFLPYLFLSVGPAPSLFDVYCLSDCTSWKNNNKSWPWGPEELAASISRKKKMLWTIFFSLRFNSTFFFKFGVWCCCCCWCCPGNTLGLFFVTQTADLPFRFKLFKLTGKHFLCV